MVVNNRSSRGVTVSTLDSESSDGGSNPPRTWLLCACRWYAKYFYLIPGLNWGPLACEASVITTRPLKLIEQECRANAFSAELSADAENVILMDENSKIAKYT